MRWSWVLLALAACGMSEEKFQEQITELSCEAMFECTDESTQEFMLFDSVEECVAFMGFAWASIPDDCGYSKKAAKQCIQEMEALSCDDMDASQPASCAEVYGDCGIFETETD